MEMVPIYAPQSESEAVVISSLMQAYEIDYFIQGGAFSSMYPGALTTSLNAQTLMVDSAKVDLAKKLLASFLEPSSSADDHSSR